MVDVAQPAEHSVVVRVVVGSTPIVHPKFKILFSGILKKFHSKFFSLINIMKILIAYYSRTGTTKKVALAIEAKLKSIKAIIEANTLPQSNFTLPQCDIEEILDTKNRMGVIGYLRAGRDAMKNKLTKLGPLKSNPTDYDLTIIGSPVWAFTLSVPARTYLRQNAGRFKKVAFFCVQDGRGADKAFEEMEKSCGLKPMAILELLTKDVVKNNFEDDLEKFILRIKNFVYDGTKL